MTQPVWNTAAGNLPFPYTLSASAVAPATTITYSLITGLLPAGLTISSAGVISGTATPVEVDTVSRFTVRATDNLGVFRDRSFSITVTASAAPTFILADNSSLLVTNDATWVEYQVQYTNPSGGTAIIVLASGNLPPGLEITASGLIQGYPDVVTAVTTSSFTLQLITDTGTATATYSITVTNTAIKNPVILNNQPNMLFLSDADANFGYYNTATPAEFTGSITNLNSSSFFGSISGTTLTVTGIVTPTITVGQAITGVGITPGTVITGVTVPATAYAIEQLTSTATDFTVQLFSIPPTWVVGTSIIIDGATPAAYNGNWIINSISGNTFTVISAINPGLSVLSGVARSFGANVLGLYTVNISHTLATLLISGQDTELNVTAMTTGNLEIGSVITGTSSTIDTAGGFLTGQLYEIDSLGTTDFTLIGANSGVFDASISGTTLTVTNVTSGALDINQELSAVSATNTASGSFVVGAYYTITFTGTTDFVALGAGSNAVGTTFTATGTGVYPATSIVPGLAYTIISVGTTDYTLAGAGSNIPGVNFVAIGVATGTGTVSQGTGTAALTLLPSTKLLAYGTGTGGVGTYALNNSHVAPFSTTNLTASPGVGQRFIATGAGAGTGTAKAVVQSGTIITEFRTGDGTTGTYGLSVQQNVSSTTLYSVINYGTVSFGDYFSFKIIGYDFGNLSLRYATTTLPAGLTLNPQTGWISGIPVQPTGISSFEFNFDAWVVNTLGLESDRVSFAFTLTDGSTPVVNWVTPANLGTIYNSELSYLTIQATSNITLNYQVVAGKLPPNLFLSEDGMIYGRVSYQPSTVPLAVGTVTPFSFVVEAYDPANPLTANSLRQFTINVEQKYDQPVETAYFVASPPVDDRIELTQLLNSTIIPDQYVYRLGDPYFGRATSVTYQNAYGIYSSNLDDYIAAMTQNYYNKQITLGELQTAVARDSSGKIIYEVVYSKIIDDLTNINGQSVSKEVTWPYPIPVESGTTQTVYPNSLTNMRDQLGTTLNQNLDQSLYPRWMVSQQRDGSTLGFTPAWVICYTKPNMSETVKNRILTLWPYKLNAINFVIDRLVVDKSSTFNYDSTTSTWTNLPGAQTASVDVIRTRDPNTMVNEITAAPATPTNTIAYWSVNMPIKFSGTEFGGILANTVYYVKSIDTVNNRFTISASLNTQDVILFTDSGLMTATPVYPAVTPLDGKNIEVLFDRQNILSKR